ncbi:MAG: hypothetical protein ABFS35_17150 [Bacteroidota bacterium]
MKVRFIISLLLITVFTYGQKVKFSNIHYGIKLKEISKKRNIVDSIIISFKIEFKDKKDIEDEIFYLVYNCIHIGEDTITFIRSRTSMKIIEEKILLIPWDKDNGSCFVTENCFSYSLGVQDLYLPTIDCLYFSVDYTRKYHRKYHDLKPTYIGKYNESELNFTDKTKIKKRVIR